MVHALKCVCQFWLLMFKIYWTLLGSCPTKGRYFFFAPRWKFWFEIEVIGTHHDLWSEENLRGNEHVISILWSLSLIGCLRYDFFSSFVIRLECMWERPTSLVVGFKLLWSFTPEILLFLVTRRKKKFISENIFILVWRNITTSSQQFSFYL